MSIQKNEFVACPCCGTRTLGRRKEYEICPVCFWEDDPIQDADPDYIGGANTLSLNQARAMTINRAWLLIDHLILELKKANQSTLAQKIDVHLRNLNFSSRRQLFETLQQILVDAYLSGQLQLPSTAPQEVVELINPFKSEK